MTDYALGAIMRAGEPTPLMDRIGDEMVDAMLAFGEGFVEHLFDDPDNDGCDDPTHDIGGSD